jgi:hypothetical protein
MGFRFLEAPETHRETIDPRKSCRGHTIFFACVGRLNVGIEPSRVTATRHSVPSLAISFLDYLPPPPDPLEPLAVPFMPDNPASPVGSVEDPELVPVLPLLDPEFPPG